MRKIKGGSRSSSTVAPVLSYPLQDGAASQRESAMMTSSNMNAKQQAQINQHGGSKCSYCNHAISKRSKHCSYCNHAISKRSKHCSYCNHAISKRSKHCSYCNHAISKRSKHCSHCNHAISKRSTRRKTKSSKRRFKKFTRGGNATNRVTVPSFPTNSVSPTNANSISVSTNSASLQSNANASGDCYATNSC
jgi:hypothetical protein